MLARTLDAQPLGEQDAVLDLGTGTGAVRRLFPDYRAMERGYFRRTGAEVTTLRYGLAGVQ